MSFNLTLFSTSDDPHKVEKKLSQIATVGINPTGEIDILSPTFIINYNSIFLSANYCYCPFLSRYYFITGMSLEIGKQIKIEASVDVLMSYATQLKECTACVTRSESVGSNDVVDTQLPINQHQKNTLLLQFIPVSDYPFTLSYTDNYLLEVL